MSNNRDNIAIIEPSEIYRRGIAQIISEVSQLHIERSAAELPDTVNQSIDIAIVNPAISSPNNIRQIFPNAKLIAILYNYVNQSLLRQFDDMIELCDSSDKIIQIIDHSIDTKPNRGGMSDVEELSDRECEVLAAVAKGMINKEIADYLNISIHTVIAHRKNISRKTSIRSVSGLVVYALLNNLITESEILM